MAPSKVVGIHEFHLSKCDIDYSMDEQALQIAVSIFIDDLEATLAEEGFDNLGICSKKESADAEEVIMSYLQNHLIITVDGEPKELTWIGKEISEDLAAVWCYLVIANIRPTESIKVTNDILMSAFDDQQNVVKLTVDKKRKSFFLFNRDEYTGKLDL